MNELISDVAPGMLPPRIRATFLDVGLAIGKGWKPGELAKKLGVAPSVLSDLLGELRLALGLLHGIFPTPSDHEVDATLRSIAEHGVETPIVVDEHGIIDGYVRVGCCEQLAWIEDATRRIPNWESLAGTAELGTDERRALNEEHGKATVDDAIALARYGAELVALAGERRWADPPIDRRRHLSPQGRRQLAVRLNVERRHLHRGELRAVIEMELMIDGARTNRAIANLVGSSEEWVRQVREQLARDEQILSNPPAEVETQVLGFATVASLPCPHCHHDLRVMRGGREFALEELDGP